MNAGLVQAVLVVPNANNPLGCIVPEANKQRLAIYEPSARMHGRLRCANPPYVFPWDRVSPWCLGGVGEVPEISVFCISSAVFRASSHPGGFA